MRDETMLKVKGTFDGEHIVLDEPVTYPPNTPVEVIFITGEEPSPIKSDHDDEERLRRFVRMLDCNLPLGITDLAAEHDHYLYGIPKRSECEPS
jgi:hypothetical protein